MYHDSRSALASLLNFFTFSLSCAGFLELFPSTLSLYDPPEGSPFHPIFVCASCDDVCVSSLTVRGREGGRGERGREGRGERGREGGEGERGRGGRREGGRGQRGEWKCGEVTYLSHRSVVF